MVMFFVSANKRLKLFEMILMGNFLLKSKWSKNTDISDVLLKRFKTNIII